MLLFITAILSFVWRSGSTSEAANGAPLHPHTAIGPRIAITVVFGLGLVYLALVINSLRQHCLKVGKADRKGDGMANTVTASDGQLDLEMGEMERSGKEDGGSSSSSCYPSSSTDASTEIEVRS